MMHSQARSHQEDSYEYQQGYESQRACYNDQYSDPYGYGDRTSQEQYQPRRPPPRSYDDKAYDEYDDPPRKQSPSAQYDDKEYGDYNYSRRAPPPPRRRSFNDDPPESYQESYYDLDYEHSRRAQPLRRDASYDHSREYRTPRYYPDSYEEEYHDHEDYYYEHRRSKKSDSHLSYKSQSYTQNTPPPKKKSFAEHMYERWFKPKPRDPNDPYKTITEHMCEDMKLQVNCHACRGPHYRYQCQKYPYCNRCKAKLSCQCRDKPHRDGVDQGCKVKPRGKYGLSEETWALARRLGINIVPDDGMEEDIRVTPRVNQGENNHGQQVSFKAPLEDVIEDTRKSELETPVGEEVQDQEKENQEGGCRNEFEDKEDEEVEVVLAIDEPHGNTFESPYGKNLHSSCGKTTLGDNRTKSWADMCDDDDDMFDDVGVPILIDNSNVDCVDACVENVVVEMIGEVVNDEGNDCDNSFISEHDNDMHEIFHFDDENNVDASLFESDNVEFSDFLDTYLDDALVVHNVLGEEKEELIGCEKSVESIEGKEKDEKEETREESDGVKDDEVKLKEKRKEKEKKKVKENSILVDIDSYQPLEESMLYVELKEFLDARHLRAYLEKRVDGEKGLVPVQVCFNDGLVIASSQGR